jgi:hypothetical protein
VDRISNELIRADHHHVSITISRSTQCSTVTRRGRGVERRQAVVREAPLKEIDVKTYVVDAEKVAEAIVERLLAGGTLRSR